MSLPVESQYKIASAVEMILQALGEDVHRSGLKDTPERVARMYSDILDGNHHSCPPLTVFDGEAYEGQVMVHHVPFYAFCEHHLMPFYGHLGIGYIPTGSRVVGLSKLVRSFRYFTKKPTIQERITKQVVQHMMGQLKPEGAICVVQAEHMCMTLRGVKSPGSFTTTIDYDGVYTKDTELRQQFINEATQVR